MDRDGDAFLDRAEIAELRRLVRRAVKPKRCARLFPRLCDRDADRRVSREEWSACLGLDFNPNDCLSDQKTALEEQVSGTSGLYIPECTPDGRYKKVQCYTSTGYCWCVYEDTGIVIPGTSVKDQKPNCDIVPPPTRPMAGCPEPRKQIFLREFLDFMKKKMISTKEKSVSESAFLSLNGGSEEAVATWAFQNLDKNKNKIWERKEWKSFRTLVMSQPALRRCGKRLPRYCDVNNDQKISLTEWLNCMKNHQTSAAMSMRTASNINRNGTNPLMIYLKAS